MKVYFYCLIISILFLGIILYFIKKRILDIKYSALWIIISILMIVLCMDKNLLEDMAGIFGISYSPSFLFLIGILFLFLLNFNMTIIISNMQRQITRLNQEVGILKSDRKENTK